MSMSEATILIPNPYTGLTVRLGREEINVHEVHEGTVYYGRYNDNAHERPWHCVGLYRKTVEEFVNGMGRALLDGAVMYSRLS